MNTIIQNIELLILDIFKMKLQINQDKRKGKII